MWYGTWGGGGDGGEGFTNELQCRQGLSGPLLRNATSKSEINDTNRTHKRTCSMIRAMFATHMGRNAKYCDGTPWHVINLQR
jgi:hypothetical protein